MMLIVVSSDLGLVTLIKARFRGELELWLGAKLKYPDFLRFLQAISI